MKRTPLKRKTPIKTRKEGRTTPPWQVQHIWAVKRLPCVICAHPGPSDAHHVIHDRFGSRKSSHTKTIPLCKEHHQDGPDAIHNGKRSWREKYGADHEYVPAVMMEIYGIEDPSDEQIEQYWSEKNG